MDNFNELTPFEAQEVATVFNLRDEIVEETENYIVKKTPEGKFKKEMKYKAYISFKPETEEEEIELYKLTSSNEDNEDVIELKNMVGKEFELTDCIITPYESFNEDTGESLQGVSSIMRDEKGFYIATSSKSVYHSLMNLFKVFGFPHEKKYKSVTFKVTSTKRENGNQLNLSLIKINK